MLSRSSELIHRGSGVCLQTPTLIPSFSSKGFQDPSATVLKMTQVASGLIKDVALVSAFDISKGHLPLPYKLSIKPKLTIVDSGGYEMSGQFSNSEVRCDPRDPGKWDIEDLVSVIQNWPDDQPALFVSYDNERKDRRSLRDQVIDARWLFDRYARKHLRCLLIKPEPNATGITSVFSKLDNEAAHLRLFDVIGVTEKELESSAAGRMTQIAELRRGLDANGVSAPIHVFGSLDPVSVCLYTIAGAEMFDGLTWLRYAYSEDDQCVYENQYSMLNFGFDFEWTRKDVLLLNNISYLEVLQDKLRKFSATNDFSVLPHSRFMEKAWLRLQKSIE